MGFVSIQDIPLFQKLQNTLNLLKHLTDLTGLKFPCFDLDSRV